MRRKLEIGEVSKAELLARLQTAGVRLNAYAGALFADERFVTLPAPCLVETVTITVAELGLPDGGTFDQIAAAAAVSGLMLCPLEVGPHFRLAFLDQPEGFVGMPASHHRALPGSITIASAALSVDDDFPKGFYVRRIEGALWLRGYCAGHDHIWNGKDAFVFLRAAEAD